MAIFQQSPGVQIIEKNVSGSATGASSTVGAYVGVFQWGPVMSPMLISNESQLVSIFGKPNTETFSHFFSAANFLTYTSALWVNRTATANLNATAAGTGVLIKNITEYELNASYTSSGTFAARYPGSLGNGLTVSMADSATFATWAYRGEFTTTPGTTEYVVSKGGVNDEMHIVVVDKLGRFTGTPNTVLEKFANVSKAIDAVSYQGIANYYVNVLTNRSSYVYWTGHPTGTTNWGTEASGITFVSMDSSATNTTVLSATATSTTATLTFAVQPAKPYTVGQSITVTGNTPIAYNGTFVVTSSTTSSVSYAVAGSPGAGTVFGAIGDAFTSDYTYSLAGGIDDNVPSVAALSLGWDLFLDIMTYDISLLITGNAKAELAAYVTTNIADVRRDCVAFSSISNTAGPIWGTSTTRIGDAIAFKTFDSTYAVVDSGYKYMYDKYNDKYRWIALNADIAGLCARVDAESNPWFSPAGMVKGQIKGAMKLSWNPSRAERDQLYPATINPVINQVGQGTILFGDRTATLKPSAFDRINVRRLFLVVEKTISEFAKFQLFEINDSITRNQFVSAVEPFLRDVQSRRGIDAFKVICDGTNNTAQVIASNEFRGTILIRPLYSINFITLTFTAVGPTIQFEVAAGA